MAKRGSTRLSRGQLAKLEKRFRERRQVTKEQEETEARRQIYRRQRLIMAVSFGIAALVVLSIHLFGPEPQAPPMAAPLPPMNAPQLGAAAHRIPGCREVESAFAPLLGLAEGSKLARKAQYSMVVQNRYPLEIENSVGMRLRLIPHGTFIMGSPKTERGRGPDESEHSVYVAGPFYMGKYEVTQGEWEAVMGTETNPSRFLAGGDRRPVEEVTWRQCNAFAEKLCQREGVPPNSYRLPTEEEWEYACRAGSQAPFCFGHSREELKQYANFIGSGDRGTQIVGSRRANAWGLHDMHGNVWEWCANRFYTYLNPEVRDPLKRAIRGGNWRLEYLDCRSASRYRLPPDSRGNILGFRILRTLGDIVATPVGGGAEDAGAAAGAGPGGAASDGAAAGNGRPETEPGSETDGEQR